MDKTNLKFRNPNYDKLLNQVRIDNKISKVKESLSDEIFSLISVFAFNSNYLKNEIESLVVKMAERDVKLSNIFEHSVIIMLAQKQNIKINDDYLEKLKNLLKDLINSSTFPVGKKGLILFFVKKIHGLKQISDQLNKSLISSSLKFYNEDRNVELIIDSYFACDDPEKKIPKDEIIEEIKNKKESLSKEKLAKAIIKFAKTDSSNFGEIVNQLEEKINNEYSNWTNPDIWFSISKKNKIINSNLSPELINLTLENIKEKNKSFAEVIHQITQDGIYISEGNLVHTPNYSPLENSLCLLALKTIGRDKIIQLSQTDKADFDNYKIHHQKGILTNLASINVYTCFVIVIMIVNTLLLLWNFENLKDSLNDSWITKTNPKSPKDILSFLSNPIMIVAINLLWIYIIRKELLERKFITIKKILTLYPVYKLISSLFNKFN